MPSNQPSITVVALVLLLPLAGAESTTLATLRAASVSWTDADLSGTALALQIRLPLGGTGASTPFFHLSAPFVKVEADTSEAYLDAPATTLPVAARTTHATLTEATLEGSAVRADSILYVFPTNAAEMTGSCAVAQPARETTVRAASKVHTSRPQPGADTSRALEVAVCEGSEVTVSGSFLLVLWERDATWTAKEGSGVLWSGKAQQEAVPGADARPFFSKAQQLYLHVQDGTFRIAADEATTLFLEEARVAGAALTLHQASGQVHGEQAAGRRVELAGNLEAALGRSQDALSVQVGGLLAGASVDGSRLDVAATTSNPAGANPTPWLLAAAGAAAAPALLVPVRWRRRRLRPHRVVAVRERAEEALAEMEFAKALPWTAKLRDWLPDDSQANFLHALALTGLGRPHEAMRFYRNAEKHLHPGYAALSDGELAYGMAVAVARLHLRAPEHEKPQLFEQGLSLLRRVHAAEPDLLLELQMHEELASLLERFHSGLQGYA